MKDILEIAAAIILSLGGGGAIIIGLSNWIGKIWADKYIEKMKAQYSKEIEFYKNELNKELQKLKTFDERALYISKAQYDNEYRIYQEIWEKLHLCILFSMRLFPLTEGVPENEDDKKKYVNEKYHSFGRAYNEFSETIDKYAPFYKEVFYNDFEVIRKKCSDLGHIFKLYESDIYNASTALVPNAIMDSETYRDVYIKTPKELDDIKNKLQNDIREYLLSLQLN